MLRTHELLEQPQWVAESAAWFWWVRELNALADRDEFQLVLASTAQRRAEQDKRQALEQQLSASEQAYFRALSDAQRDQGRLRDRLATADLRLSVLVDATDAAGTCAVSAAATTGSVVHGPTRAQLDPTHAQRIIGITDAGDQGLIALAACQAYAKEVSTPK